MIRAMLLTGIVLAGSFLPAVARVTDAGARSIGAALTEAIDDFLARAARYDVPLFRSGPVTVVPAGDHYAASVPPLGVRGEDVRLGGIEGSLTPTPEGWLELEPRIADPFLVAQDAGERIALTIARQSGTVTYAPGYRTVMAGDLALEGIGLEPPVPPGGSMGLGALRLDGASTPVEGDRYDQHMRFAVEGATLDVPQGRFSLDRSSVGFEGTAFELAAYVRMEEDVQAFLLEHDLTEDEIPPELIPEILAQYVNYPPLFHDLRMWWDLEGLLVDSYADATSVDLDSGSLSFAVDGIVTGATGLELRLDWKGLAVSPLPSEGGAFLPTDLDLGIGLAGLPNADIMTALRRIADSAGTGGSEYAAYLAMSALAPVLMASDTLVLGLSADAETRFGSIALTGKFRPDAMAVHSGVGKATITVRGIDRAIAEVQSLPDSSGAAATLGMLKLLGRQGVDEQGRPVLTYAIVLGRGGELTMNGTDLRPLLGL